MKLRTRKEMAEMIVDNQIARGIVKQENRYHQVKARLVGSMKMGYTDLYNACVSMNLIKEGK